MSRTYRHIKEYEKEIMRSKEEGVIEREIPLKVVATIFATKNRITRGIYVNPLEKRCFLDII
ncbi:MAG: hypothetical protein J6R45_06615 [Clostridia bacterium]|nr:hypothetical protein [Clostridia bacterium]